LLLDMCGCKICMLSWWQAKIWMSTISKGKMPSLRNWTSKKFVDAFQSWGKMVSWCKRMKNSEGQWNQGCYPGDKAERVDAGHVAGFL
jgi:hypothetical protein